MRRKTSARARLAAAAGATALLVGLVACGGESTDSAGEATPAPAAEAATEAAPLPTVEVIDGAVMGNETLPSEYPPHWVWVSDISFFHMIDGRSYLVDADSGAFKGFLSVGGFHEHLTLPKTRGEIIAPATYYSRGTRGTRTDAVTFYDPTSLRPTGEVVIPPKRHSGMPMIAYQALTDDERFLAITNMTPAQSVTIVDLDERAVAAEIPTPGCALVYGAGARRIQQLCGSGRIQTLELSEDGGLKAATQSEPFFDVEADPVMEKARRVGDTWYYVSFQGNVHPVDVSGDAPAFGEPWSLRAEGEEAWRPGGTMPVGVHEASNRLYVLMHEGGEGTHKDPGADVWVYDLGTKERVQQISLGERIATSIQLTQDDAPLLLTTFVAAPQLEVYDAATGAHQRTIGELGLTPIMIQTP